MKRSRKTAAALATLAVFAGSLSATATSAFAADTVAGDFNNDGKFTLSDITETIKAYADKTALDSRTMNAVDTNKDGKLTLDDITGLVKQYADKGSGTGTGTSTGTPSLKYNGGTELRMAAGYNNLNTAITFHELPSIKVPNPNASSTPSLPSDWQNRYSLNEKGFYADPYGDYVATKGDPVYSPIKKPSATITVTPDEITLADGKTYKVGDLKPAWAELQNRLNVKFTDKFQGKGSTSREFEYWKEQLDQVDVVNGSLSQFNESGNNGQLIDLSKYLNNMPNFKAFLDANPIVRLSINGNSSGAIYGVPYFDGINDVERVPLMRTDWVEKLLNGKGEFSASASKQTASPSYTPYMPANGRIDIEVVRADGSGTEKITKNYDKSGNIIEKMNARGSMSGVDAVNMLRRYIDEAYDGYYGENRADLFIGQNAAWDADELVALLRCIVANPQTLNGTDTVQGLFTREESNNLRRVDMFRVAGELFGVRGLNLINDYIYIGTDNKLHDARMEEDTYAAMERMNSLAKEGLISQAFINNEKITSQQYLEKDLGFMSYDYSQTQTYYNWTLLQTDKGEAYRAVMIPIARWYDGSNSNGTYMRFSESWRSVKSDAIALSAKGIGNDQNKLNAALTFIDYIYSKEGQILMSYGPDGFIKKDSNGNYINFNFNGEQWPVISDAAFEEMMDKGKGNYTNYGRQIVGTMMIGNVKSQAFEFQNNSKIGQIGLGCISRAIELGTIKHPELKLTSNPWYTSVPTTLPLTNDETGVINGYVMMGSRGAFSTSSSISGSYNIFVDIIAKGYAGVVEDGCSNAAQTANTVKTNWGGEVILKYKQAAWESLLKFYRS